MRFQAQAEVASCPNRVRQPARASRPGFSLIEVAGVLALLTVVLGLIAATLMGTVKIHNADATAFHRMAVQSELIDQLRTDVAQAAAAPENFDKLVKSPTCLILRRADGSHVVYRWHKEHLERWEKTGTRQTKREMPLADERLAVEFIFSKAAPRLITLRLVESQEADDRRPARPLEIAAALGGDLQ